MMEKKNYKGVVNIISSDVIERVLLSYEKAKLYLLRGNSYNKLAVEEYKKVIAGNESKGESLKNMGLSEEVINEIKNAKECGDCRKDFYDSSCSENKCTGIGKFLGKTCEYKTINGIYYCVESEADKKEQTSKSIIDKYRDSIISEFKEGEYPVFEFKDGTGYNNLYYRFNGKNWEWSPDGGQWMVFSDILSYVESSRLAGIRDPVNTESKIFIQKIEDKSYNEGVKLLIDRTLVNNEGGWFLNTGLSTERVDLNSEEVFIVKTENPVFNIGNIHFKYNKASKKWEWSTPDEKVWTEVPDTKIKKGALQGETINDVKITLLIGALQGQDFENGAKLIFGKAENGVVAKDEKETTDSLKKCSDCGEGIINRCDQLECNSIGKESGKNCVFIPISIFNYGNCVEIGVNEDSGSENKILENNENEDWNSCSGCMNGPVECTRVICDNMGYELGKSCIFEEGPTGTICYEEKIEKNILNAINYAKDNDINNGISNKRCNCGNDCNDYAKWIEKYSNKYSIDEPLLILSVMMQESNCDVDAGSGSSYGLMQISENTFNGICDGGKITGVSNFNDILGSDNAEKHIECGVMILKSKYDILNNYCSNSGCSPKYAGSNVCSGNYCCEDNFGEGKACVANCNSEKMCEYEFDGCENYNKYYFGWEAALRGYVGWGCADRHDGYVEEVMNIYNELK